MAAANIFYRDRPFNQLELDTKHEKKKKRKLYLFRNVFTVKGLFVTSATRCNVSIMRLSGAAV